MNQLLVKQLVKSLPKQLIENVAPLAASKIVEGLTLKAQQLQEVAQPGSVVSLVILPGANDAQINFHEVLPDPNRKEGYIFGRALLNNDVSLMEFASKIDTPNLIQSYFNGNFDTGQLTQHLPEPIEKVYTPEPTTQAEFEENHLQEQEVSDFKPVDKTAHSFTGTQPEPIYIFKPQGEFKQAIEALNGTVKMQCNFRKWGDPTNYSFQVLANSIEEISDLIENHIDTEYFEASIINTPTEHE